VRSESFLSHSANINTLVVTRNYKLSVDTPNLCEKLGHVNVHDGLEQQNRLILFGILEFEIAGGRQHRFDSSHAVVVVVLRGQLLRAQLVRRHDLLCQTASDRSSVCQQQKQQWQYLLVSLDHVFVICRGLHPNEARKKAKEGTKITLAVTQRNYIQTILPS